MHFKSFEVFLVYAFFLPIPPPHPVRRFWGGCYHLTKLTMV